MREKELVWHLWKGNMQSSYWSKWCGYQFIWHLRKGMLMTIVITKDPKRCRHELKLRAFWRSTISSPATPQNNNNNKQTIKTKPDMLRICIWNPVTWFSQHWTLWSIWLTSRLQVKHQSYKLHVDDCIPLLPAMPANHFLTPHKPGRLVRATSTPDYSTSKPSDSSLFCLMSSW